MHAFATNPLWRVMLFVQVINGVSAGIYPKSRFLNSNTIAFGCNGNIMEAGPAIGGNQCVFQQVVFGGVVGVNMVLQVYVKIN